MVNAVRMIGAGVLFASLTACTSSSSPAAPSSGSDGTGTILTAARPDHAAAAKPGGMTIVEIVLQEDGEFDILQAAVIRAGLVDALSGPGQRTVFAPTDAAFVSSLGVADEAAAIEAVNGLAVETLTNILLYHVTEGRRNSRSVLAAPGYEMANGQTLSRAELTGAGIVAADVSASNGIIHVIGAVLMP